MQQSDAVQRAAPSSAAHGNGSFKHNRPQTQAVLTPSGKRARNLSRFERSSALRWVTMQCICAVWCCARLEQFYEYPYQYHARHATLSRSTVVLWWVQSAGCSNIAISIAISPYRSLAACFSHGRCPSMCRSVSVDPSLLLYVPSASNERADIADRQTDLGCACVASVL